MHIGIDLRLHAYSPGGIAYYARRLAQEMAHLLPPGTLTLLPHRREEAPLDAPGARVHRAWTPPHHRLERWLLSAELWALGLDLLHTPDFIPPQRGARHHVITVHDLNFFHYPQYLTADARRYYNEQIGWAVDHADAILVDSYATQRDLETMLDVPAERITVTHLATDAACFQPLSEDEVRATLARYDLTPGYLLFVGTWEPRKNLAGLLDALSLLHARGEKRELVIAGRPGWLYDEIFERVQRLGLTRWVHFIERVPLDDLVALMNGALLLTMPSFYEGFGLPALEAMHCGTPTVVADRASLPEVVGDAGLLIDPDDPATMAEAYGRIARDAALREELRAAGRRQAQTFTWERTARQTLEVYGAVLGTSLSA